MGVAEVRKPVKKKFLEWHLRSRQPQRFLVDGSLQSLVLSVWTTVQVYLLPRLAYRRNPKGLKEPTKA